MAEDQKCAVSTNVSGASAYGAAAHCCTCCRADDEESLTRHRIVAALQYATAENSIAIDDETRAAANRYLRSHWSVSGLSLPDFKL